MAYGFGATLGTATTDRIQLSITPTTGQRTYIAKIAINGPGGGTNGLGRFLDAEPSTSNTEAWFREASTNRIIYNRAHTSQNGAWSCPCQADVSGEHVYGISIDGAGTASPTMFFDGVSQTITIGTAPIGGAQTNTAPIYLGNRSPDWGRGLDGKYIWFAAWNNVLTAQQHLDYYNGADPTSSTGWTSGSAPTGFIGVIPMESGNVDPYSLIVSVTGAKLLGPASASGGTAVSTGSGSGGSATGGTGSADAVASGGTASSIGSCSGGSATGLGVATTLASPVDRGNISLSESSVTNAATSTPTVTMMPRRWVNEQKTNSGTADNVAKSYFFYGSTSGVANKTPTYKMKFWSSSSHSEATELFKWHYVTPLDSTYRPAYSYDARNWLYFDNCSWNADGLYLDFWNNAAFTSDTVYFASALPWQTDKTAEWIAALIATASPYLSQPASAVAYGGDAYQIGVTNARTNELGETIASCKVYGIKISSGGLDPNGHSKRKIVLVSGTHAGEDLGNWCLKGAVEFLLGSHAKAVLARQWCDFYIYPMTDSSGRRGGHRRSHFDPALLTADGNRYWGLGTLAETNQIVAAILTDTGGYFSASFDFHAGHATPAYYDVQAQASNDTFHTAIQTYVSGIVRYIGDIANSMMGWAENTIGAKICVTPEFNSDKPYETYQVEDWGAAHMKALADVAATNYLYAGEAFVAGATGVSTGSGTGGAATGQSVTNATASGGTATSVGTATGGSATATTSATASSGTAVSVGTASGGSAVGTEAGQAVASGGTAISLGTGSGGSAIGVIIAIAEGAIGISVGSGRGGAANGGSILTDISPTMRYTIPAEQRRYTVRG